MMEEGVVRMKAGKSWRVERKESKGERVAWIYTVWVCIFLWLRSKSAL